MEMIEIAKYPVTKIREVYKGIANEIKDIVRQGIYGLSDYDRHMPDICDVEFEKDE